MAVTGRFKKNLLQSHSAVNLSFLNEPATYPEKTSQIVKDFLEFLVNCGQLVNRPIYVGSESVKVIAY